MPHSPASASGDQPPAELGLTAQDLAARLTAEGELTAEDLAALARLDDAPCAGEGPWDDDDPAPGAGDNPWDDDPGADIDRSPRVAEVWDAGFIHNVPGDPGYGFASGGILDRMLPGRELAAFTGTALGDGLGLAQRLRADRVLVRGPAEHLLAAGRPAGRGRGPGAAAR